MNLNNQKNPIPNTKNFQKIIRFYLLECPVRTRSHIPKKDRDPDDPQAKYKFLFRKVSKRGISFEDRHLDGPKLNSLRAAMQRVTDVKLIVVDTSNEVETVASEEAGEFVVIKRNEDNVSVTEGYFYAIRNAFAHGDFDVDRTIYKLCNEAKGEVKGLARIKESSLLKWIELVNMDIEDIKKAGK